MFGLFFYFASILGASLSLGMSLAEPLLSSQVGENDERPNPVQTTSHLDRPALLAVGLGTLLWGIAHVVVALFNGLSPTEVPLLAPMGFIAGLGLSLALYFQPRSGRHLSARVLLPRLVFVAFTFALTQLAFITFQDNGTGIVIVWTGDFYRSEFSRYIQAWQRPVTGAYLSGPNCLALIDAALVGSALTIGTTFGLLWANKSLVRRRP